MTVRISSKNIRFFIPLPTAMIGLAIRWMPDRVLDEIRAGAPEPYRHLITKEYVGMVLKECRDVLRGNKGLEIIHVEAGDGTYVSVKL